MAFFGQFCLDKEKDILIRLDLEGEEMTYTLTTPNHHTGNLITNLAAACGLPLSFDEAGLKVIRGPVPCWYDAENRRVYILRFGGTKVANIYADGAIERKAAIPAIVKTLMSQTKDYRLDTYHTLVKTWIPAECKFRTDLHTHMNANLDPDLLIALGIAWQIRYPLYYIKKLGLRVTEEQRARLLRDRAVQEEAFAGSGLQGKYLDRRIDDHTFINFADLILRAPEHAAHNIPRIRCSLAVMKDGQAVFTNLEKVYLYRYVFTKGVPAERPVALEGVDAIPDRDIAEAVRAILRDREDPRYAHNTLFQDELLWVARTCRRHGVDYMEITDTSLVRRDAAPEVLRQVHAVMPAVTAETGVTLRFLAGIRRIPLTIVRDRVEAGGYLGENLAVLRAVAADPYVAGSDIIGEEMNDIRDLRPLLRELVRLAGEIPSFVVRIHAGENDGLRDNVGHAVACVRESLAPGQPMPRVRVGHGLYTVNLSSARGKALMRDLRESGVVLEFQITSNVRLNNLTSLDRHPLKQYLHAGVRCVQGTDGGAIYGTDSLDEQLTLMKLLHLDREELMAMRAAEDEVRAAGLAAFAEKSAAFETLCAGRPVEEVLRERIALEPVMGGLLVAARLRESAAVLADRVRDLPADRVPVVVAGGSFHKDGRAPKVRPGDMALIDALLERADPERVFFVVGHRLTGQEKYLVERASPRFDCFAIVPTMISAAEEKRLRAAGVGIRVSIEPTGMGLYKSFAYEIFKRRPSMLIAFDGNTAAENLIQEGRNSRCECRIHVSAHSRLLSGKAQSIQGYVTIFRDDDAPERVLRDLKRLEDRADKPGDRRNTP